MHWDDDRLIKKLKRYLANFLVRKEDIDDTAQDALVKVLEASRKENIKSPPAYLLRTARNLAFNKLSSSHHRRLDYTDQIEESAASSVNNLSIHLEQQVESQQQLQQLIRVVDKLPEQCRKVFILRKVYGHSQKEVAKLTGLSESTVEKHVSKGITLARQHFALTKKPASDRETKKSRDESQTLPLK